MLSLAGAEDMTQRRPNPYFLRPSATSSQAMHPMADFAAKELKLKRIITITEDFAFGHEQIGGFQQTFEDAGGKIVNKIWPPLVTPDYTPFVAQIADCDGLLSGLLTSSAGILFVYYTQFISPQTLSLTASAEVLLMVISSGPGTLLGPIVGAGLVVMVKTVVSGFIERWNFLLGAIFVAIVILMPEGIVPGTVRLWRLARRRRAAGKAEAKP